MTMETNTRWLSLLSIAWLTGLTDVADDTDAFRLHCGVLVTAEVGDTVTLLCHTNPSMDVRKERVEWLYNKKDDVHLWRNGKDDLTGQMSAYKNRTSLFVYELSKGNCSLKLSDVLESDSGPYRCAVKINEEKECYTNLNVLPPGNKTSHSDQPQDPPISSAEKPGRDTDTSTVSTSDVIIITAVYVVAGIVICLVSWIFPNPCAEQDRGRPGEEHELAPMAGNIPPDPRAGQDREDLGRGEEE